MKYLYIYLFILLNFNIVSAQDSAIPVLEREITVSINNEGLPVALTTIARLGNFVFSYSASTIDVNKKVSINITQKPVRHVLNELFQGTVTYKVRGKYIILQPGRSSKERIIEGYVYDSGSGKKLTETTVYDKNLLISAVTDKYGYFKLELPADKAASALRVSKEGYADTLLKPLPGRANYVNIELSLRPPEVISVGNSFKDDRNNSFRWFVSKKIRINARNLTDSVFRQIQVSFLPMISTSKLLTGSAVNKVSLNVLIGYVQSVRSVEVGGVLNIVRDDAGVCQLAGVGNIVGRNLKGVQLAGVYNIDKSINGVQSAGVINIVRGDAGVFQSAGVGNIVNGNFRGLQLSGVYNIDKSNKGVQAAGVINIVRSNGGVCQLAGTGNIVNGHFNGFQAAGAFNITNELSGYQIAGAINQSGKVDGLQIAGAVNNVKEISGVQVSGFLNRASYFKGVQLGLINLADSCKGIPIGFFSYVKKGYHKLEFSADEIFYTNLAFRTGVKRFHTIMLAGMRPDNFETPLWTFGYGAGTTFGKSDKLLFDFDIINQQVIRNANLRDNQIYKIYAGMDKKIGSKTSLTFGITYNFFVSDTKTPQYNSYYSNIIPYTFSDQTFSDGFNLKTWLGFKLAVRFL